MVSGWQNGGPWLPLILARFDAASRSPEAFKAFRGADRLSADCALDPETRRLTSTRVRQETENNAYAKGMLKTLAEDTIGTGPRLNLSGGDDKAMQRRERRWRKWAKRVKLVKVLKVARMAKARDGECFLVMGNNPGLPGEIPVGLTIYEAEQCGSEYQAQPEHWATGETKEVDGILFDRYGNPKAYRFWRVHPGEGCFYATDNESMTLPARAVIHYANLERPGQHRGLSEMASDIRVFADTRRYSEATVNAAEICAQIAMTMKTTLPPDDGLARDKDGEPDITPRTMQDVLDFPRRSIVAAPEGWELAPVKSEQPTTTYCDFVDKKNAEAARALSMPASVAMGDSAKCNYASGRLDHQMYHKAIAGEREQIETEILDRLLETFEAVDAVLHPEDYDEETDAEWYWPGWEHVDPVKESTAQGQRLANRVTTLKEECAKEGKDYHEVLEQAAKEAKEMEALGIAFIPVPAPLSDKEETEDAGT